jgi:hypothetical protein
MGVYKEENLCAFVLYSFPHRSVSFHQIWYDDRGLLWGDFNHLTPRPKVLETLKKGYFLISGDLFLVAY